MVINILSPIVSHFCERCAYWLSIINMRIVASSDSKHEHFKKNSSAALNGFPLSIVSLCGELANWCPLQCRHPCLLRRCRAQKLCEKGKGEGGAADSSPLALRNGMDKGGNGGSTADLNPNCSLQGYAINIRRNAVAELPQHCMTR